MHRTAEKQYNSVFIQKRMFFQLKFIADKCAAEIIEYIYN